jgi:hypothetical protein
VGARTATDISHEGGNLVDQFKADVAAGKLPQVTWIVAPEAFSEHGNWPTNYGAWYISQFLDAPTARPDVWSKGSVLGRNPANLAVKSVYETDHSTIRLEITNKADSSGWYDLTVGVESDRAFAQQLAGHLESGCDSTTDPLIGSGKRKG